MTERMPLYKCKNCAWLSVRLKHTRELVGADDAYRDNGYVASTNYGGRGTAEQIFDSLPVCFANWRDFYDIVKTPQPDQDKTIRAISEPIPCPEFEEWNRGISPQELRQMKMLEEQRAAIREDTKTQRAWQAEESRKADERHKETIKEAIKAAKSNERSQWGAGVIGAVATLLTGLLAAAATIATVWLTGWLNPPPKTTPPVTPVVQAVMPSQPTPPDVDH
jgi:hypothetical protein